MQQSEEASDAQLILTLGCCGDAGLAELYRRHGDAVYGLARRILKSSSEAEDITQEVFLRLNAGIHGVDP